MPLKYAQKLAHRLRNRNDSARQRRYKHPSTVTKCPLVRRLIHSVCDLSPFS